MLATDPQPSCDGDDILIDRAKNGDRQAYKRLYELHVAAVYGLALRLVNEARCAEDVTQEVFIRVWRSLKDFRGESRFSSWLHRVTSNTAVDYLRKQRSWLALVFEREEASPPLHQGDHALQRDLEKLIARLPQRARLVFVLYSVEGYRHEEIAEITGMAVGSSKAQLHRAKALLKEWMQE